MAIKTDQEFLDSLTPEQTRVMISVMAILRKVVTAVWPVLNTEQREYLLSKVSPEVLDGHR